MELREEEGKKDSSSKGKGIYRKMDYALQYPVIHYHIATGTVHVFGPPLSMPFEEPQLYETYPDEIVLTVALERNITVRQVQRRGSQISRVQERATQQRLHLEDQTRLRHYWRERSYALAKEIAEYLTTYYPQYFCSNGNGHQ